MTNMEYIKTISVVDLAKFNVKSVDISMYDYDSMDNLYEHIEGGYQTSDGEKWFDYDYNDAIEHEIEWLMSEVEKS